MRTLKNKLCAVVLVGLGLFATSINGDATVLVMMLFVAIPLFLAKKNYIMF